MRFTCAQGRPPEHKVPLTALQNYDKIIFPRQVGAPKDRARHIFRQGHLEIGRILTLLALNKLSSMGPAHSGKWHNFAYNNYPPDLGVIENVGEIFTLLSPFNCL